MNYYVYITSNNKNSMFYIGVTRNIIKRIYEHKNEVVESFTKRHKLKRLVYYEVFNDPESAIKREKQLKNWHHDWKANLIQDKNPDFKDLYHEIL
jgi:putative endonuclease